MRENMGLYRGKRKDNGEWIYGSFFYDNDVVTIFPNPMCIGCGFGGLWWIDDGFDPVDPETVGQFTGLFDSTKWEDLTPEEQQAFLHQPDGGENTPEAWPGKRIFEGDIIEWDEKEWGCDHRELVEWNYSLFSLRKNDWKEFCKIIGNIHDNPELLEVK